MAEVADWHAKILISIPRKAGWPWGDRHQRAASSGTSVYCKYVFHTLSMTWKSLGGIRFHVQNWIIFLLSKFHLLENKTPYFILSCKPHWHASARCWPIRDLISMKEFLSNSSQEIYFFQILNVTDPFELGPNKGPSANRRRLNSVQKQRKAFLFDQRMERCERLV